MYSGASDIGFLGSTDALSGHYKFHWLAALILVLVVVILFVDAVKRWGGVAATWDAAVERSKKAVEGVQDKLVYNSNVAQKTVLSGFLGGREAPQFNEPNPEASALLQNVMSQYTPDYLGENGVDNPADYMRKRSRDPRYVYNPESNVADKLVEGMDGNKINDHTLNKALVGQ